MIFVTLMLPIPVRIVSTYEVMTQLGWVNTYWGLTVPLMASATGTFLFRQFYQTIPDSLAEAAQLDGAGPHALLWSILLPLSKANIAALFVILFVYGWNEYLWPLMITTTPEMRTAVVGVESLVPRGGSQLAEWNVIMAAADHDPAAAGGGDHRHAALVREGPHRDGEVDAHPLRRPPRRRRPVAGEQPDARSATPSRVGARVLELDVHQTADGAIAVIHDPDARSHHEWPRPGGVPRWPICGARDCGARTAR